MLDVNHEIYRIDKSKSYYFSIGQDKSKHSDVYDPNENFNEGLYAEWEYIVHGTVFEVRDLGGDKL